MKTTVPKELDLVEIDNEPKQPADVLQEIIGDLQSSNPPGPHILAQALKIIHRRLSNLSRSPVNVQIVINGPVHASTIVFNNPDH